MDYPFDVYDASRSRQQEANISSDSPFTPKNIILGVVTLVILIAICVGGAAGCKSYGRYQKRADAQNTTQIVKQQVKTAHERTRVNKAQIPATVAEADKRYEESRGIRRAQDKISKTLTPLYIQHEAIQAQRALVNGPNHSTTFIPVGPNGVPLVKTSP